MNSLSIIKKFIPKIIRSDSDNRRDRDDLHNEDSGDNRERTFGEKSPKSGGVLAPFYFETASEA